MPEYLFSDDSYLYWVTTDTSGSDLYKFDFLLNFVNGLSFASNLGVDSSIFINKDSNLCSQLMKF